VILAFVACFAVRCSLVELPFDGTGQQCLLFGQHEVARWLGDHPGYTLRGGWRCTTTRRA